MEDWVSGMSYKLFLLEKELGYCFTGDFPALALVERLRMFDRYIKDKSDSYDKMKKESKKKK